MKIKTMFEQGYGLSAWTVKTIRGERRVVLALRKKTTRGERLFIAHSPQTDARLTDVEFTEPMPIG